MRTFFENRAFQAALHASAAVLLSIGAVVFVLRAWDILEPLVVSVVLATAHRVVGQSTRAGLMATFHVSDRLDEVIASQAGPLDSLAGTLQGWIASAFRLAGSAGQTTKNALNGVWLGHPLHPALTDVPIGAWTLALVFDFLGLERGADAAVTIGVLGAAPAAVVGSADWVDASEEPRRKGLVHALLNVGALGLYLLSLRARATGNRALGVGLSTSGFAVTALSAWVGGELVYRLGTNVNRSAWDPAVTEYQVAAPATSLKEGKLVPGKITVDGRELPLVLLRRGGDIFAIGSVCPHWGGPLAEGKLVDGICVECPWHASQFDLRDGRVRQGPATAPAPVYEARLRNGMVEVRRVG